MNHNRSGADRLDRPADAYTSLREIVRKSLENVSSRAEFNLDGVELASLVSLCSPEQRRRPLVGQFSLEQLERMQQLYYSSSQDHLVSRVSTPVLIWNGQGELARLLETVNPRLELVEIHQAFFLPQLVQLEPRQRSWLRRLVEALAGQGEVFQAAWLCDFPAPQRGLPWLACHQPEEPVALEFVPHPAKARHLLLNLHHPSWSSLWDLDPEWGMGVLCQPLWNCFPELDKERLLERLNSL